MDMQSRLYAKYSLTDDSKCPNCRVKIDSFRKKDPTLGVKLSLFLLDINLFLKAILASEIIHGYIQYHPS